MEYIYAALLIHRAGKEISEENITKILSSVEVEIDESRVKALIAALDGVDIDDAIASAALAPIAAAPTAAPAADEGASEDAKDEKKEEEEEEEEESAIEGLGALFG